MCDQSVVLRCDLPDEIALTCFKDYEHSDRHEARWEGYIVIWPNNEVTRV
jgi:hypothetical protein